MSSRTMSTSVLEALPDKPDIKRHSPSILYISELSFCHLNTKSKNAD